MTILTRQERERLVLDLYNQGKTYREISKEARISPRDIGVILNNEVQEKTYDFERKNSNMSCSNKSFAFTVVKLIQMIRSVLCT